MNIRKSWNLLLQKVYVGILCGARDEYCTCYWIIFRGTSLEKGYGGNETLKPYSSTMSHISYEKRRTGVVQRWKKS